MMMTDFRWTHDKDQQVRELRHRGLSYMKCAGIMGASSSAIARRCVKLGITVGTKPVTIRPIIVGKSPCQWPMWGNERPTHVHCGKPAVVGKPYCPAHLDRAWSKVPPKGDTGLLLRDRRQS